jgi:hypothetical protein
VIPWYVFAVRIEHDVGRPLIPLTVLAGRHRAPRRLPGPTVHARAWRAAGYGRRSDGCAFSSLGIRLQAIQPWPYRADLAAPRPGRLQTATASLTCYVSLGLSPPGKSGDPRTSLRVHPDCVGDTTKRLTAHTMPAVLPHTAYRRRSPPAFGLSRQGVVPALGVTTVPDRLTSPHRFGDR